MTLREGPRQILTGLMAAGLFLLFYFGLELVMWLAVVLAGACYMALLLVIPRQLGAHEKVLDERTTQADLSAAAQEIASAVDRLERSMAKTPDGNHQTVSEITAHLKSICTQVAKDPEDYRRTRRFVASYLPKLVVVVESFSELTAQSQGRQSDRLATLAERIEGFLPIVEKIDTACLENDFLALEAQMEALEFQMKRG